MDSSVGCPIFRWFFCLIVYWPKKMISSGFHYSKSRKKIPYICRGKNFWPKKLIFWCFWVFWPQNGQKSVEMKIFFFLNGVIFCVESDGRTRFLRKSTGILYFGVWSWKIMVIFDRPKFCFDLKMAKNRSKWKSFF